MSDVYPLVFEPIVKHRIWGGRNLERLLDKSLPPDTPIGESWELVDLPSEESRVANGPARGRTLHDLVEEWGRDMLGDAALFQGRFPLLVKFLDAQDVLSVQVHPDDAASRELGPDVRPKYEAWYVIDAKPGAAIYCGLKDGVTKEDLARASRDGTVGELLCKYDAKPGDCFYLPAGTVHAIGAGLVIAEPQTPSDVTYRLFDWNRVDPKTGKGRELHLEQALHVTRTHYTTKDIVQERRVLDGGTPGGPSAVRLVACEAFVIDRYEAPAQTRVPVAGPQMAVWIMLTGSGRIHRDGPAGRYDVAVKRGDTVLLPAGLGEGAFMTDSACTWLRVTVPQQVGARHG